MKVFYFKDDDHSDEVKTENVEVFTFYRNRVVCYLKYSNEEIVIPLNRLLSIEEEEGI